MRAKVLVLAALLASAPLANACINTVGTDHSGRKFDPMWYVGEEMTTPMLRQEARKRALGKAQETIDKARWLGDFASLTDLGVLLIYQGQYVPAVHLFVTIEKRFPGHHETAANLGTALELAGQNAVALKWIRIGIQRNLHEHEGTEWLHARILEAKIALARDPDYLKNHSVAGITFEPALVPALPVIMPAGNDGKPLQPWQLNQALSYQLFERTQFVAPKDPVVANLLMDFATLNLAGGPIESADALYEAAVDYGAPRDELMRKRKMLIKQTLARASESTSGGVVCGICQPFDQH